MTDSDSAPEAEVVPPESGAHTPAVADDVLPETLCLMPIPNRPFFPGQVQPVAISGASMLSSANRCGS